MSALLSLCSTGDGPLCTGLLSEQPWARAGRPAGSPALFCLCASDSARAGAVGTRERPEQPSRSVELVMAEEWVGKSFSLARTRQRRCHMYLSEINPTPISSGLVLKHLCQVITRHPRLYFCIHYMIRVRRRSERVAQSRSRSPAHRGFRAKQHQGRALHPSHPPQRSRSAEELARAILGQGTGSPRNHVKPSSCGEGPGCPGGRQVDPEPAVCPGCQEGQWDPGMH